MSLRSHLAAMDVAALTALLEHRADVLVEPAPHSVDELAQRLNGVDSLSHALPEMDYDEVATARAVALLGAAPVAVLAGRLRSAEADVRAVLDRLAGRGLAWEVDATVGLPERLAQHFADGLTRFRPLAAIAKQARVDDLRVALSGLGADPRGLTKPGLVERLTALLTDPTAVAHAAAALPPAPKRHLDVLLRAGGYHHPGSVGRGAADPATALTQAGLLVGGPYHRPELPREVAVALLLDDRDRLTGRPDLPASGDPADDGRAGADAGLLALTGLLDEAGEKPLARLKKGGIGARERARLATRLGVTDPALWIDIAHAAGLLAAGPAGYGATGDYPQWREAAPAARWARAVLAWYALDLAPTSRETDDGEVAPPLPLESAAGMLRRAVLRAAAGGRSVRAAAQRIDWFCPLHGYDVTGRDRKTAAAVHEAGLLGVVAGDRLSALGELLVEVAARPDAIDELARRAADLLPETRGLLVLQSDLTALVSGQTSAATARLLAACATPESRGVTVTWRFGRASVRAALDAGWTVEQLRAELREVSGRELPQPLDYLLSDVARRHGSVRVRGSRSCVTGAEAEITEILHTRSLAKLHLSRLAPTVLSSPFEIDEVLAKLRASGFSPMPEDGDGVVIVAERATAPVARGPRRRARPRVTAAELAARLQRASRTTAPVSPTHARLCALAGHLDSAEIALLADALDHGRDVRIRYRNRVGNRSVRDIAPKELWDRWLDAWCYLRSGEREFTVTGIEAVSPVG